jgi:prepilin-type N-terminal cleavage/methylation domain-containing protein
MIKKTNKGFTIIEVMIASGLFVIISVIAIGMLLNINRARQVTSVIRQSMDTLYFVMEDMTRNIRLGTDYECFTGSSCEAMLNNGAQRTLHFSLEGLSGSPSDPNDQIVYWIRDDTNGVGRIYKSKVGDNFFSASIITPSEIDIDITKSGFSVYEVSYPLVTLRIVGSVSYQNTTVPFNIQTSISPRNI